MYAIDYIRISDIDKEKTQQQLKEKLDNQHLGNLVYAKEKKLKFLRTFNEGYHKSTDRNRAVFNDMFKQAIDKRIVMEDGSIVDVSEGITIIVREQSRWARDSSFMQDTLDDINAKDVIVVESSTSEVMDWKNIKTRLYSVVDEEQIYKSRGHANASFKRKVSACIPVGKQPFGYKYDLVNVKDKKGFIVQTKSFVIVKNEAMIVKDIFNKFVEVKNIGDVVDYLNEKYKGYVCVNKTKSYKFFEKDMANKKLFLNVVAMIETGMFLADISAKLCISENQLETRIAPLLESKVVYYKFYYKSVRRILNNKAYICICSYTKKKYGAGKRVVGFDEMIEYKADYQRIIPDLLYRKAQRLLNV